MRMESNSHPADLVRSLKSCVLTVIELCCDGASRHQGEKISSRKHQLTQSHTAVPEEYHFICLDSTGYDKLRAADKIVEISNRREKYIPYSMVCRFGLLDQGLFMFRAKSRPRSAY